MKSWRTKPPIWARSENLTVTQNVLTSLGYNPDAIIAANDDMALGALEAIQQMGILKGKILVLGIDGLPEALVKIREGEMAGSVQFPIAQVRMALDALVSYLRDKKPIEGKCFCLSFVSAVLHKPHRRTLGRSSFRGWAGCFRSGSAVATYRRNHTRKETAH
jgi:ABC-type sugar transport system substrate-binding protein